MKWSYCNLTILNVAAVRYLGFLLEVDFVASRTELFKPMHQIDALFRSAA